MTGIGDVLGIIGGVAGLIVLFTGALVFMRGSYNKARIEALRQDIADYRQREDSRERDIQACNLKIEHLTSKANHLESENTSLRELVTQRAAVENLAKSLNRHHAESLEAWKEIRDAIEKSARDAH